MAIVLSVSADDLLSRTRRLILEKAGHHVMAAFSVRDVEQACHTKSFEVVVIGQGVPLQFRTKIGDIVRRECPNARILELYVAPIGRALSDADDWLEVPGVQPQELEQRVAALAANNQSGELPRS